MANPRNHSYDALEGAHGYHLNTAEDSQGDEHLYVQEFNARLPEIKAYMQTHHVPAEDAFRGVTGKPWPEGRSVELKRGDSVGFMTKDRTIRSVLGKGAIAAGIGAGAYFAAPAIAGAMSGGAPVAGGASTAGAASGTGAGAVGGGVLAAGETGLTAAGGGVLAPLASTALPGSLATGAAAGGVGTVAGTTSSLAGTGALGASAAGGAGSTIGKMMQAKDVLGDAGDIGNSIANDQARDRTQRGNWAQQYDRIRLAGNEDDRQMESDAMRKAQQTSYIMGGGAGNYTPAHVNSGQLPSYGFGPKETTPFEKQAASTLQGQLLARLSPEGHFKPTPLDSYAKAGTLENIGRGINYGTAIGNTARNIWDIYKG